MASLKLKTALIGAAHHEPLIDGSVQIPGVELEFVPKLRDNALIFRHMARDLEFDMCELSCVTYFAMREHRLPVQAIPVVPRHQFHHGDFLKNVHAGIESPKDLEGKRVAARTWTLTPGVLDRGILTDEYGVDLDSITWLTAEPEHVAASEAQFPPNVSRGSAEDLFPQLVSGEIQAALAAVNLGRRESPDVAPLFPNALELDRRQYERTGIVPVFSVIAIKQELCDANPWLPEALFEGFRAARTHGVGVNPGVERVVEDPEARSPFGRDANRESFDELLRLSRADGIISRPELTVDELFPNFN